MRFSRHAFISYAHVDNSPLLKEKEGWVTVFHEALTLLLSRFIGGKADVWRDKKLTGNDIFSEEIMDQFPQTAVLISVLTPRYLKSEWCGKEIRSFCEVAEQTGGVVIGNKSRVFKVIKTPYPAAESLPPVVGQTLGYEFYDLDDDQTPRELDPEFGEKPRQDFLRKVNKLAWDIKELLDQLMGDAAAAGASVGQAKPAVYLADCTSEHRKVREALECELTRLGYPVCPDRQLPTDENDLVEEVERLMADCMLSIHLVGSNYGAVPDGKSEKSVVVLQNEIAARSSRERGLRRVIYLPANTQSEQVPQQAFIDAIHNDAETQFGADLITGGVEELKSAVYGALKKIEGTEPKASEAAAAADVEQRLVYVICDPRDRKDTVPLLRALKARGLEVRLPVFTGDAAEVRQTNEELLRTADAIVLFYGAGDELWKTRQETEIRKLRRAPGVRPPLAVFTYLGAPLTDDKDLLLTTGEPGVIDGFAGVSDAALAPFLGAVSDE